MYRTLQNINSISNTVVPVYQLYKYNSLTHNQEPSGSNYFTITSGYPCQGCHLQNQESYQKPTKDTKSKQTIQFKNKNRRNIRRNMQSKNIVERYSQNDLEELDIVCYYSDSCGYCKMTLSMLEKEGVMDKVTLKNLSNKENVTEFRSKGGRGVPFFESQKTKKQLAGYPQSVDNLVAKLS